MEIFMDVEIINPFLKSVMNVLSTMAMIDAKPGKPYLKEENEAKGDVTGMIGMAGNKARASFAITFKTDIILRIASNMFGEEVTEFNNEIADMVGEITNMVTGGAKSELAEKGYKFDMAIPTTIMGESHSITHNTKGPVVLIPFNCESGEFFVEVCFEKIVPVD
jgi:chemotaxis protein CheX